MNISSALQVSVLKTLYLSARFKGKIIVSRGTRIRLGRGARIELAPGSVLYLGRNRDIGTPLSLRIRRDGRLSICGEVTICCGTRILIGENAHLELAERVYIHYDAKITCWDHISIGADSGLSWDSNIIDGNGHDILVSGRKLPKTRPVIIGSRVWIGTGVIIAGASIGDGAMVGAGSIVTTNIPPKALVTGNPGTVRHKDIAWER